MPHPVAGHLLQLVRRPVTEVERARRAELERIPAGRDVLQMERRRAPDHLLHGVSVPRHQRGGVLLQEVEKAAVPDQRGLHRFRNPAAPIAVGERRQEAEVVDHGERRRERAQVVLLPVGVDAVLHADRRIILRQHRRRHANQAHAAVRGRRGKTRDVEDRPAADGHEIGMAAEPGAVDRLEDTLGVPRFGLDLLAAGDHEDRPRQRNRVVMREAIAAD